MNSLESKNELRSLSRSLLNKSFKEYELERSPVGTSIYTFENEDRILDHLSQIASTPEQNSQKIMANGFYSGGSLRNDHNSMVKNRITNKHRNVTVSRPSKSLGQTYKYATQRNATGTRTLEKFLKEYSQDSRSPTNPNFSSMQNQKNLISSNNNSSLAHVKDEATKKYKIKRLANNNGFSGKSIVSSKIIHGKNTLHKYFKEMKNIKRTLERNSSSRASGSIISRDSISDKSNTESINGNSYFADLEGCARVKGWPEAKLHIFNKVLETTSKNTADDPRNDKKCRFNSPVYKRVDCVAELEKKYGENHSKPRSTEASSSCSSSSQIKRKCRSQKLNEWFKNNPLQINTNLKDDFKSLGSKNKTQELCSSEISFAPRINEHKRRNDQIRRNFHEQYPKHAKMYKKQSISKNTIPRYFSKNNFSNSKEITICASSTFKRKYSRSLEDKKKASMFTNCANNIDFTENATMSRRKMDKGFDKCLKNSYALDNSNPVCLTSQYLDKKHNYPIKKIGQSAKREAKYFDPKSTTQKTQKNIYSSEGFCESMSVETLTLNNNQKSGLYPNNTEKDSSLEINNSILLGSNRRSKKNTKTSEKFKQISDFMNFLTSQPEKLSPEQKKEALREEREMSPNLYVMKMCGPESEALVRKVLNSHKNPDEKQSLNNIKSLSESKIAIKKDIPSDPLSFGSSSLTFSGNINSSQVDIRPASTNCSKFLLPSINTCSENKYSTQVHSQLMQKKEKRAETIENLCKLHESNSWTTDGQARPKENLKSHFFMERNSDSTQSLNLEIKQDATMQPKSTLNTVPHEDPVLIDYKYGTESCLATKNTLSSEIFATQGSYIFPNVELTDKVPLSATQNDSRLIHSTKNNVINDPFSYEPLTKSLQNILHKNYTNFYLNSFNNSKEYIAQSSMDGYHTRKNCETMKDSIDCHIQINYEDLEPIHGTQTQTETLTENVLETQIETQNTHKKLRKTYNITKDCILYKDNLLKSLIEDKQNKCKTTKQRVVRRDCSEELDSDRRYIKRYKKGNIKIFKIKRRVKKKDVKHYNPPEGHIMDRFLKKLNNDFQDESSGNSDPDDDDDDESVSTPNSYQTDKTKSEALSTGSSKLTAAQKLLRKGINKLSKDKSLLFLGNEDYVPNPFNKSEIIANIEQIVNQVLEDFVEGRNVFFKVPKQDISNSIFANDRYQIRDPPKYTTISYKHTVSQPKFNLILFLLNKIKHLLESDFKLTKREIYYQLKTIISSQRTTDTVLKDISRMLNVGMWALNITAQKGLVYGNLKLIMDDGETVNCNVPGTLIPHDISKICEVQSTAYFILVIEKEAIFHKLLQENLPNRLTRPFIMITGKGFPDLNTQLFLKKLWMIMSIPVFILVDADPDGIAIMLNYRFGSIANAHVSGHLAIPKARWLGVFPSEILKLNLSYEELSKRDVSMTQKLLQLPCVQRNENIQNQLQKLLENGIKTGIESLVKTDVYLSNCYLNLKFYTNDLI